MSCLHSFEAFARDHVAAYLRCAGCQGWAELEVTFEGCPPLRGCDHVDQLESFQVVPDGEPLALGCRGCGATWTTGWWHAGVGGDENADSRG